MTVVWLSYFDRKDGLNPTPDPESAILNLEDCRKRDEKA
jgi:hypothetical protein